MSRQRHPAAGFLSDTDALALADLATRVAVAAGVELQLDRWCDPSPIGHRRADQQ